MIYYQYDEEGVIITRIRGSKTPPISINQFASNDDLIEIGKIYDNGKVFNSTDDGSGNLIKDLDNFVNVVF